MKNVTIYNLLAIVVFFAACAKSQEDKLAEIREIEASEKAGTTEGLKEIAALHKAYGLEYEDAEANELLYAAGQYYFFEHEYEEAKPLLEEYLTRDDSSERYRNATVNLAILHGEQENYTEADKLISSLLDTDLPTAAQWQDIIKLYEDKVKAKADLSPSNYERLAMAYTAVGRFEKATNSLEIAIDDFPEYEKRANLLYRAGFIGWEYLKNPEVAQKFYNRFLEEYPNDPKADEVKQILSSGMLEMSDEDILNMLKGKGN